MTKESIPLKQGSESVRFLGNWHESIPRILFMDPFLRSHDRNVYCVIRTLMSKEGVNPDREMRFPSYSEIMQYGNIGSRATVARAITTARIIGWIVQSNPSAEMLRDPSNGRFLHKQWLLLDEPMPHREICQYDHGYVAFIEQATTHKHAQTAELARRVYQLLIDEKEGDRQESIYERRLAAYEAVIADPGVNRENTFFGIPLQPLEKDSLTVDFSENVNSPGTVHELGRKSLATGDVPGKNPPGTAAVHGKMPPSSGDEHGNSTQTGANSPGTVGEPGENDRVRQVNSGVAGSSRKIKTTTTKPGVVKQRAVLFDRIGFNPNFCSIFSTRFDRLPDEYQELIILEMHARMDRRLNRNDAAYLGHLLKTTRSALENNDPGLLIFTPEYSSPVPVETRGPAKDPATSLKQELQEAQADYRHWQRMLRSATTQDQVKQVNVMVDMAKTKMERLAQQTNSMQKPLESRL